MVNFDLIHVLFFFILYSVLEVLITSIMEDYRLIETEEYQEGFEDEEEVEEEEEDEEGEELGELIPRVIPIDSIEDEDYEDEDDYENDNYWDEDEDYWDEDDEDDEDEEPDELIPVEITSLTISSSISNGRSINDGYLNDSNDLESCEGKESLNGGEIDGLFCPICFEAWTSGGSHQICCLPCGHIYGLSCINKWLQLRRSSGKCPQCKRLCTLKDVRVLYAARLCVADEELHKKVRCLEAKCAYLEQKDYVERIKEELREELKRDMDEKWEKLKREMVEKMDKLERDMEEIRMVNEIDEYVRNQNQQQNADNLNEHDQTSGTR
ncbi:unnamed protein product [Lactuca virosa]|uniref:RING-type domain-containing protein n=1 Tax=Lactuca virosa TaxID=75947 RepID=A0AAU9PQ57_9ASTR|nr:unnamed protein product [Lactuca virosa]